MKIRFTQVVTENVGGSIKGISASYEASDSDGFGNVGIDSDTLAPSDSYQPTYASVAAVEALSQTQIYNDFYDTRQLVVDSFNTIIYGEIWLEETQENLNLQIEVAQNKVAAEAGTSSIEVADEITDQTPIDI